MKRLERLDFLNFKKDGGNTMNPFGRTRSILLCEPRYFSLQPINTVASDLIGQGYQLNQEKAIKEHKELANSLNSKGIETVWVDPSPRYPYQMYTRDLGALTKAGVLFGNFRADVRKGEEYLAEEKLKSSTPIFKGGGSVDNGFIEGGDIVYLDETMVAVGMGARSSLDGVKWATKVFSELDIEVIPVPFDSRYLHLDTSLSVITPSVVLWCPENLPAEFQKLIKSKASTFIEVKPDDVLRSAANVLAVGDDIIFSPHRNQKVNNQLKALGFDVVEVEIEELLNGGGGIHCLTLEVVRD